MSESTSHAAAEGNNNSKTTISVSLSDLAKMIDHSLLHPTLTDADVVAGLVLSKKYNVASACVKPYHVPLAAHHLAGASVLVCPVIGFPAGNSTTATKVFEASEAAAAGGREIDMVVNVGKALSGEWAYVEREIAEVNAAVAARGAVLKVIFENDYLTEGDIVRLCEICNGVGVAFIKTSTGYGFVKQANGDYNYEGATLPHLKLMRAHAHENMQIKAAGGVRTLDDLLRVRALGVTRVGATATAAILEEAKSRGIGAQRIDVEVSGLF